MTYIHVMYVFKNGNGGGILHDKLYTSRRKKKCKTNQHTIENYPPRSGNTQKQQIEISGRKWFTTMSYPLPQRHMNYLLLHRRSSQKKKSMGSIRALLKFILSKQEIGRTILITIKTSPFILPSIIVSWIPHNFWCKTFNIFSKERN